MERAARTFRVFVSSTFADLKEERDALQERVFPRLQAFCLERGARFQAIDLRWGVSAEAGLDQQTINICLDEIKRCQDTSPRPNFIVLLGDRYGWQPPPPQIPEEHFDQILDLVPGRESKALLQRWYPLDQNAVPPEHYLKPRTGRYRSDDAWGPVERRLRRILEDAVRGMPLEGAERRTYETSATEEEVQRGALSSLPDHVFCYFRSIDFGAGDGLPAGELIRDFLNLDEEGVRDETAAERLERLKGELRGLPRENVHDYRSRWTGDPPVPITTRHLDRLCRDVYEDLVRIITQELERTEGIEPVQREIEAHAAFGQERARFFTGRTDVLSWIAEAVERPDGTPRLVYGPGGSGKSAVMARAAQDAARRFPDGVVTRFIGATPDSSNGRALLDGLCREISQRFGGDPSTIPSEFRELARDFRERLALASEDRPLVIFLDALDQLSPADGARSMSWLPTALPPGVRLVVSTLSGDLLGTVERRIPPSGRMELLPMEPEEAGDLLDLWLREADRTLKKPQRDAILRRFAVNGLPLWLKLAYEEARRWTWTHEEVDLPPTIDALIKERLFARLEDKANHGPVMVSRSLGYLAAAKNGLTEDEMIDLLSTGGREGEVLVDFRRRAPRSPDVDRLPLIVWSRLFYDLEPYLTERAGDGTSLMGFYHRQLAEAAEERYLAGTDGMARHREVAGRFADQPLEMAGGRANLRKMSELPYQLTMAAHRAGEARSSLADGLWDEVVATLTDFEFLDRKAREVGVVTSVDADGNTATTHTGIYEVRDDFDLALEVMPGRAEAEGDLGRRAVLESFGRAVARDAVLVAGNPEMLWQQLYNRVQWDPDARELLRGELERRSRPGEEAWLRVATHVPESPALRASVPILGAAVRACAVAPGGDFVVTAGGDRTGADWAVRIWEPGSWDRRFFLEGHRDPVDACAVSPDGRYVVSTGAYSHEGKAMMFVWDPHTGETLAGPLILKSSSPGGLAVSPDGRFVATADGDHVTIWDPGSWEERWHLPSAAGRISSCAASPDGRLLAVGGRETEQDRTTVVVWDAERWEVVTALSGGEGAAETLAFSPDGSRLLLAHGAVVSVVDTETWESVGRIESPANDLAWGPDGSFVVSCDGSASLSIWEADGWTLHATLEGHEDAVLTCAVTPDGTAIVSGGLDDTLNVWDVDRALRGDEAVARPPPATLDGDRGTPSGRPTAWDLATGALEAPDDVVAISPDGSFLVTDAGRILDAGTRAEISRLTDVRYPDRNVAVFAADASPDGSVVVTTKDRLLRAWDPRTGREMARFEGHTGHVNDCAISPDGRFLLSASYDTTLRIWNLATGEELRKLRGHVEVSFHGRGDMMQVMGGLVRGVMACAWSPDGSFIVSAGADGSLRIWDPRRGRTRAALGSASRSVESCAVTPDGRYVVSADDRRVMFVNEVATGAAKAVLVGPENVVAHPGRPLFGARTPRGFVEIEAVGLEYGPLVALVAAEGAWRCPACREVAAGPKARPGRDLQCPACGAALRIPDLRRHRSRRSLSHRLRRPIVRRRAPSPAKSPAEPEARDLATQLREWGAGYAEVEVVVRPWEPQWWLLRRADFDKVESRKRKGWTAAKVATLLALAAGGVLVFVAVRSAAVAIAAPLLAANLAGRFRYVLRRPRKIRRSLYSLVAPGAGIGLAILLHTWTGSWWLAVPVGLLLGWVVSVPLRRLFFPGIVEEGL